MTTMHKPVIPVWKRIIFMLIVLLVSFGGCEVLLRVIGFKFATGTYELTEGEVIAFHWSKRALVRDPLIPWSWIPEPGATATQPARNDFSYNSDGFRGPEYPRIKANNVVRVVCMGDSCTLGWDSPMGETYPDFMRQELEHMSPGQFQVINAGVSGFTSFQGIRDFHQRIKQWHPDILVVSYNWNDHGDAPDRIYGPAVFKPSERRQFPDNAMPDSTRTYNIQHQLQRMRIVQAATRFIWTVQGRKTEHAQLKTEENGALQSQQSAFSPGTGLRRVGAEDFRLNLWEFTRLANQQGIELIFMTQPANPVQHREIEPWVTYYEYQDQYNELIRRVAGKTNTALVDPLQGQWLEQKHFYDHVHTRPDANKKIALQVVPEVILATGRLDQR